MSVARVFAGATAPKTPSWIAGALPSTKTMNATTARVSLSTSPVTVRVALAPGDAAPAVIHLDKDLPAGPWDATVTVRSGELVKQAKATITFPDTAGTTAKPVVAESVRQQRRVLIPIAVALAGVVLAGLGGYALRLRRRRRPSLRS